MAAVLAFPPGSCLCSRNGRADITRQSKPNGLPASNPDEVHLFSGGKKFSINQNSWTVFNIFE